MITSIYQVLSLCSPLIVSRRSSSVSGACSLAWRKAYRMIALTDVNRRCITSCDLHRHVNHFFERSGFAKRAEVDGRQQDRDASPRPGPLLKHTESPRKQVNRFPVFCLSIWMPEDQVEFAIEPNKQVAHLRVSTKCQVSYQ
jgi:hypothetical protein